MSILNRVLPSAKRIPTFIKICGQIRESSFKTSLFLEDINLPQRKYDITNDPVDWEYINRILPPKIVPEPLVKERYPSGWKPQAEDLSDRPYYIARNKYHELPLYLNISNLKTKRTTVLKRIKGDIWLLEKELKEFLTPQVFQPIRSQVNEFTGFIRINGDFLNAVKYFLEKKGY